MDTQLDFITEFELSHRGMIGEIENELDYILHCFWLSSIADKEKLFIPFRDIMLSLRKLLIDEDSLIKNICPGFLMPPFSDGMHEVSPQDHLYIRFVTPSITNDMSTWIPLDTWLNQILAYFDRKKDDIITSFPERTYNRILGLLPTQNERIFFSSFYDKDTINENGNTVIIYKRKTTITDNDSQNIFDLLDKIGYNKLTIGYYIRNYANKRVAHIDTKKPVLMEIIDQKERGFQAPPYSFAIQLIYAVKKQIPEFSDYFPMLDTFAKSIS